MNSYKIPSVPGAKMISLCRLLDQMVGAVRKGHRNFFINDVPRTLTIAADKNMLDPVIVDLLTFVSSNPGITCIRISAYKSENEVMLSVKTSAIRGLSLSGIRTNAA